MAISRIAAGAFAFANNAAVTPSLGGTTQLNDLALEFSVIGAGGAGRTGSISGGYTNDVAGTSGTIIAYLYHKLVAASEADPTFTPAGTSAGENIGAQALYLRGVNTSSPVHAVNDNSTGSAGPGTPLATPTLTISQDNCYVLIAAFFQTTPTSLAVPSGTGSTFTAIGSVGVSSGGSFVCGLGLFECQQTTAANLTAGSITITGGGNATGRCAAIAIAPNVAVAPPPAPAFKPVFLRI